MATLIQPSIYVSQHNLTVTLAYLLLLLLFGGCFHPYPSGSELYPKWGVSWSMRNCVIFFSMVALNIHFVGKRMIPAFKPNVWFWKCENPGRTPSSNIFRSYVATVPLWITFKGIQTIIQTFWRVWFRVPVSRCLQYVLGQWNFIFWFVCSDYRSERNYVVHIFDGRW